MASSLPTTIRDVITTAPIYAAFVHGSTDLTDPQYHTVPDNVYLFELAEVGEYIYTSIDELLWTLIKSRVVFANGITRGETSEDTADVLRNIIMYRPGDTYCERRINITSDERDDLSWGFFKNTPGDHNRFRYLTQAPYIETRDPWLRELKASFFTHLRDPIVTTNTGFINHVLDWEHTRPLIIFINSCSALRGKASLTSVEKANLTRIQLLQQRQLQTIAQLGLQLGAPYVHTSAPVAQSRKPAVRTRGPLATQAFAPVSGIQSHTKANHRVNENLEEEVDNNSGSASASNSGFNNLLRGTRRANTRTTCQKCMNYFGKLICCRRKGGRRTRKFKRSRRN
jgi:hypothetical protein